MQSMGSHCGKHLKEVMTRSCRMRLLLENKADINLAYLDSGKTLQGVSLDDHEAVTKQPLKERRPLDEEFHKGPGVDRLTGTRCVAPGVWRILTERVKRLV